MRLRRGTLTSPEVTVIDGLPVTTIERTILDLEALAAKAGVHAAKYGVRGRDGHRLLRPLLAQASDADARRRDQMATLLSRLDERQQRILAELATDTSTESP